MFNQKACLIAWLRTLATRGCNSEPGSQHYYRRADSDASGEVLSKRHGFIDTRKLKLPGSFLLILLSCQWVSVMSPLPVSPLLE